MKSPLSYLFVFAFCLIAMPATAQEDAQVLIIPCEKGQAVQVEGNLAAGQQIPLQWAASSQVACFPATRFVEFQGTHVFYRVELPRYSKIVITVQPEGNKRINLYGIRQSASASMQAVPPHVSVAGSCEADYPMYAGTPNLSQGGESQSIEFMAINNPYSILVGVAGAKDVTEGDFKLIVQIGDR